MTINTIPLVASRVAVAVAGVAAAVAGVAAAEPAPQLPITVPVAAPHTYLRAGPGDDFYPTERLAAGTMLEVWAVADGGYCAVRPVPGSHSWMRRLDVQDEPRPAGAAAGSGTIGVVLTDGAIARVGSQLNDLRHVTQVALEAGERVNVLETVRVASGRHAGEWVRIEPPAGEFRFARGEDLSLPSELAVVPEPTAVAAGAALAAAGEALAAIRDAGSAVQQAVAEIPEPAPPPAAAEAGAAPGLLNPGPAVNRLFAGWLPRGTNVFDGPGSVAPTAVSAGAAATSADELADIDLALSLAVAGPSDAWNLGPLRERLRLAATRATSETERTRAQAIDARLARFEAIQARQRALAAAPPAGDAPVRIGGMWSSLSALGSRPVRPGVMPGGAPAGGQPTWTPPDQVETTGRLATVISRRPDAPRWALVDEQNNVLTFIAPQAGLNLAPLVGQQVSIRGARGYMPEYKRQYVVAADARPRIASAAPPASAGDRTQ